MKYRNILIKKYHNLYRINSYFDRTICGYCNEPMECYDHVPAISLCENMDVQQYKKDGGNFWLIPSCSKCNNFLNNKNLPTYEERLLYLKDKYNNKLSKIKGVWTDEEIKEMGYMLQQMIIAKNNQRNKIIEQIDNIIKNFSKDIDF